MLVKSLVRLSPSYGYGPVKLSSTIGVAAGVEECYGVPSVQPAGFNGSGLGVPERPLVEAGGILHAIE